MRKRESKLSGLSLKWMVAVVLAVVFIGPALAQDEPPPTDEEQLMPGTIDGTGTYFEVTDSEYLNITLQSSEPVNLRLESVLQMVTMDIEAAEGASSTWITLTGFAPSTTYYKYQDDYHNEVAFTTDGSGSYSYMQDLAIPHHVFIQRQAGTIFLSASGWSDPTVGTWDPVTETGTLMTDVYEMIQIDSDDITLDGNGKMVTGSSTGYGVYLPYRTGVTIKNLNVQKFSSGVYLYNSSNNTLTNNTASNNGIGIYLCDHSSNNTLTGNTASNNRWGIYFHWYSSNNTLAGNTASWNNYRHGIYFYYSSYNTLTNNTTNSNSWDGIRTNYSSGNSMTGNSASNNGRAGIQLGWGLGNTLKSNTAFNNGDSGIMLVARTNTLTGNTANSNKRFGIFLGYGSSNNTLTDNTTSNNAVGIRVYISCENNTLTRNTVSSNPSYGIRLSYNSNGNQIYNNNFIDNFRQACVESSSGNVFNLPAPDGGNYWSDWTTPDADGDGFVDNPYAFRGGQDNLPWVRENGWALTPQEAIEQLIDDVADLNLQQGIDNSLDAKLDAAMSALDDVNENNDVAAINTLQAFINAVEAQRGNKISDADADALITAAQEIIDMLIAG